MSYFVSREEMLWEIKKSVDAIFTAVATCLSDDEKKFIRDYRKKLSLEERWNRRPRQDAVFKILVRK